MPPKRNATSRNLYIASDGIETLPFEIRNEETGQISLAPHVYGSINGEFFKIPCDRQVEVPLALVEVLLPLIEHQAATRKA